MTPLRILWDYRVALLQGFGTTSSLVLGACIFGTLTGIVLTLVATISGWGGRRIIDAMAFAILSIPPLVILFWFYYPAQVIFQISVSPFSTALYTLALINSFAVYRLVSDAAVELPKQYVAAGVVCGMSPISIRFHISMPLIFRASLPRWIDQQVAILQTSVFASLISVNEVFRTAERINSALYDPVVIYTAMAILFLVTAGTGTYGAALLRQRYFKDTSEH